MRLLVGLPCTVLWDGGSEVPAVDVVVAVVVVVAVELLLM